jgi:hypothetical protein
MYIVESPHKNKKFRAIFHNGKIVDFGSYGSQTYINGTRTETEKQNYIKRHQKREDHNNPYTAGALSRWILWGDSKDIDENIKQFKKKFNIL